MKRKLINLLGVILMGIGTFVFLSPDFSAYQQQKNADQEIKTFEKEKRFQKEKILCIRNPYSIIKKSIRKGRET